jgi:hypothetical protein
LAPEKARLRWGRHGILADHRHRHCGTGISPDRDIAAGWRAIETRGASLPTRSPSQPRTPALKAGVLHVRERLGARDRLSAGGSRIRTFRPPRDQCLSELVEPCAETAWRARTEFLRGGTNSSNPSPSSGELANFWFLGGGALARTGLLTSAELVPSVHIRRCAAEQGDNDREHNCQELDKFSMPSPWPSLGSTDRDSSTVRPRSMTGMGQTCSVGWRTGTIRVPSVSFSR